MYRYRAKVNWQPREDRDHCLVVVGLLSKTSRACTLPPVLLCSCVVSSRRETERAMCPHYRRHVYAQVREKLVVAAEGAQGKLTEAVVVASSAVAASVAGSKTVRGRHRACVSFYELLSGCLQTSQLSSTTTTSWLPSWPLLVCDQLQTVGRREEAARRHRCRGDRERGER